MEIQVPTGRSNSTEWLAKKNIVLRTQNLLVFLFNDGFFRNVGKKKKKSRVTSGSSGTGVSSWVFEVMFVRHMPSSQRGNT